MLSPTDQRGTRRHAVADSQRADNDADAYNLEPSILRLKSGLGTVSLRVEDEREPVITALTDHSSTGTRIVRSQFLILTLTEGFTSQ
jgi:hypothetical protein